MDARHTPSSALEGAVIAKRCQTNQTKVNRLLNGVGQPKAIGAGLGLGSLLQDVPRGV